MKSKCLIAAVLAALSLTIAGPSFAQMKALDAQLADLNSAIKKKGAKWDAGETSVSRLSQEDWRRLVGTSELKLNAPPIPEPEFSLQSALPRSLDWRQQNGVTEVKDQKKCGSCWAFAMTAGLESNALLSGAARDYTDLSEQTLVSCSGIGSCDGGTLDGDFLTATGLPPETYFPYTASDQSCSSAKAGWQDHTYKAGSWGSVSHSLTAIKSALSKYGPLPTAYMVYEDFMHYKSGVYSFVSGKKLGGHAVLLVGYNDAERYFIVKNSWGPKWGENGFFRISYSEMTNQVNFGMSTIAYQSQGAALMSQAVKKGSGGVDGENISAKILPLLGQQID